MADLAGKKVNFISRAVQAGGVFLEAYRDFYEKKQEYDSMAYQSGGGNAIVDGDFIGANAHLDAAKLNSLLNAIDDVHKLIATGSGTQNNSASRVANLHAATP